MEIRRLIEERRRNTPKEEKQRLKEVSKRIKKYQGQKKNEETARHPTNTRRLQMCKEHPSIQICKEKSVRSSPRQRMKKGKSSRRGKGLPMSLVNSTKKKNFTTTMNKKKLNKKSVRTKMRAASTCTAPTPM